MISSRDFLAYLSVIHQGDWEAIMSTLTNHVKVDYDEVVKVVSKIKCQYVTFLEKDYPPSLKNIYHPPFVLFYEGDLSLIHYPDYIHLGVIGSRLCSEYGIEVTKKLVADVAKDYVIVSGLAKGIDGIAAETAMDNGGKTIAIIGSGLDYCYPSENLSLYNRIKKDHLLISEYPEGVAPTMEKFPWRNRLIAALSEALMVTEAAERSGTSITINFALSIGKEILCVPHPIGEKSECNRLIKTGATLVEKAEDIHEVMAAFKCKNNY